MGSTRGNRSPSSYSTGPCRPEKFKGSRARLRTLLKVPPKFKYKVSIVKTNGKYYWRLALRKGDFDEFCALVRGTFPTETFKEKAIYVVAYFPQREGA